MEAKPGRWWWWWLTKRKWRGGTGRNPGTVWKVLCLARRFSDLSGVDFAAAKPWGLLQGV